MPASPSLAQKKGSVSQELARDRLGPGQVGAAMASAVAPLTVTALVIATAIATTGLRGVPIAIAATAAILMLFAVGYMAMARHIENAGAIYAYVAQGLNRALGVGTSWGALLTYNAFQLCCYGGFGAVASPLVDQFTGIEFPWFVFALATWIIVLLLGMREVKVSGTVLMVLVIAELVLVVAYSVSIILAPGFSFNFEAALSPRNMWGPAGGTLVVIAMTAFGGIEQSVVYGEESKDRLRTIPRATYGTIAIIAAVYVCASLVVISAGGPTIIEKATAEGADLFFNQASVVLGEAAVIGGKILLLGSLFAASLAFHQAIARYTFALGREGVLPRLFGNTVGGAPRNASISQNVLAFGVLVVYAFAGWDPLVQLFYWGSTTGGFGILLLVTLASIAVIGFFLRGSRGENLWRRFIAPLIATGILGYVSYQAVTDLPVLYGVEPGTGPAKVVPIVLIVVFAAGTLWGLILKFFKPAVYEGIGRGTRSSTAGTSALASVL